MELVTASNLWKDLDFTQDDLDVSVLSHDTTGGVEYIQAYFTAATFDEKSIRVRCNLAKRSSDITPKVVMIIDDIGVDYTKCDIKKYLEEGFAVFRFDYLGENPDVLEGTTLYPQNLEFCNYHLYRNELNKIVTSPQDSCWYYWSIVSFKAMAMVEWLSNFQENYIQNTVALVGIGVGGAHAIKVATLFENVESIIVKYDADAFLGNINQESIVNDVSFSSGSYTPYINIPTFFEICSNEADGSFDSMIDLYQTVGVDIDSDNIIFKRLAISENRSHNITADHAKNEMLWLKQTLNHENIHESIPLLPTLTKKISPGNVYYNLFVDKSFDVQQVKFFFSSDPLSSESQPPYRYWSQIKADYISEGEYLIKMDTAPGHIYRVYATVLYSNGYCFSTTLDQVVVPSNGQKSTVVIDRLVYDGEMGLDSWMGATANRDNSLNQVVLKQGPFEIEGVSGLGGELSNIKIGSLKFTGQNGYVLQISIFSEINQAISFGVNTRDGGFYNFATDIIVQKSWSKFNLNESDFKGTGKLDWTQAVCIRINSEKPVIVSSMLWL